MITYAIGDLHGRLDLFTKARSKALADWSNRGRPESQFIVLGDFVDRGPESAGIIKTMQEILDNESKYPELTVLPLKVIRGNHEDMMFRCCTGGASLTWWMGNGGYTTLMSYGYEDGDALMPLKGSLKEDLAWIYSLPFYIETDKQVFVHAGGLKRGKPAANHDVDELTWYCFDENWKWPDEMSGIHKDANYDKHIVHGHEQWAKGPILLSGRTDLDTFAWYTGRLAIGVFDDSQGAPIDILWVEGEPYKSP